MPDGADTHGRSNARGLAARRGMVCLAAALFAGLCLAETEPDVTVADGLATARFSLAEGDVLVRLPSDLAAGDRFTGTVEIRPRGQGEKELARLRALSVELEGVADASVDGSRVTGEVLPDRNDIMVGLARGEEEAGATAVLPLDGGDAVFAAGDREPGTDFAVPDLAQAGRPVRIAGAFDGDAVSTRIDLGDRPVSMLAESPRSAVFRAPSDAGLARIRVREGSRKREGRIRIVGVELSAGRTQLEPGEHTDLMVRLSGLEDLEQPVVCALVNESPSVVGLEGGEFQRLTIAAEDVGAEGTSTVIRRLTGRTTGGFAIDATIRAEERDPPRHEQLHLLADGEGGDPCVERGEGPPRSELTENEIAWIVWLSGHLLPPTSLTREEYCDLVSRLMERILVIDCRSDWVLTADAALGRHWNEHCREKAPHVGEGEAQTLALEDGDLLVSDKSRLEVYDAADIRRLAEQTAAHGPIARVEYVGHGCGCQGKMACGDGILSLDELAAALAGLVRSGDCTIVLYSCETGSDENLSELQTLADETGCVVKAPKGEINPWTLGAFADWVEIEPARSPTAHGSD